MGIYKIVKDGHCLSYSVMKGNSCICECFDKDDADEICQLLNKKPVVSLELCSCNSGEFSDHKCEKTPSGGWGTMKCGKPLCSKCYCECDKAEIY